MICSELAIAVAHLREQGLPLLQKLLQGTLAPSPLCHIFQAPRKIALDFKTFHDVLRWRYLFQTLTEVGDIPDAVVDVAEFLSLR